MRLTLLLPLGGVIVGEVSQHHPDNTEGRATSEVCASRQRELLTACIVGFACFCGKRCLLVFCLVDSVALSGVELCCDLRSAVNRALGLL